MRYSLLAALVLVLNVSLGCSKPKEAVPLIASPTPEATPVATPEPTPEPTPSVLIELPDAPLSEEGITLIVNAETGGKRYYDPHPEWPGASSGVTIGIGDDLRFKEKQIIRQDWHKVQEDWLNALANCSGVSGTKAKLLASSLSFITIEWGLATEVFTETTLPQYWALTKKTFPGVEELCPNARTSLCSLVFNRGSSMIGDSRKEMREIKALVPSKDYKGIAEQLLSMRRLWVGKGVDGLLVRRRDEANLILTCVAK